MKQAPNKAGPEGDVVNRTASPDDQAQPSARTARRGSWQLWLIFALPVVPLAFFSVSYFASLRDKAKRPVPVRTNEVVAAPERAPGRTNATPAGVRH